MSLTIPNNAPFTGAQRMWLKGYLDGLNTVLSPAQQAPTAVSETSAGRTVTILWGSQTGNSEAVGKKLAKQLTAKGHSPTLRDMADVSPADLAKAKTVLIVTSTYGDGEPPDNASALHTALHAEDAPSLADVEYAVFALGDSNYPAFCKCGHDFDQRLAALGAKRLTSIVECDVDYDEPLAAWISQIGKSLAAASKA
ncbi:MAG: flavodoxin domain-containing protein [Luteolibacter sp.]